MQKAKQTYVLFILLFFLSGCVSIPHDPYGSKVKDQMRRYATAVRWGSFEEAHLYLLPELQETVIIQHDLDNIRITSYDVVAGPRMIKQDEWAQRVSIEYLFRDRQVVKKMVDDQLWQYSEADKRWYRANMIPALL